MSSPRKRKEKSVIKFAFNFSFCRACFPFDPVKVEDESGVGKNQDIPEVPSYVGPQRRNTEAAREKKL